MAKQVSSNTGSYQLACEASPNKQQIDIWLNEGKSQKWISDQLKEMGDYISVNSIAKYKKYRDEQIQEELMEDPVYQAKVYEINEQLNTSIAKIKKVDMLGELAEIIDHSAELLADARVQGIQINNVKDMRMVQQTMLEAIQVYGDTMLKAQQYAAVQEDPSLLQKKNTTININIRSALTDILSNAMKEGGNGNGYGIIDQLRNGINGV
jgi:hypothetical protein